MRSSSITKEFLAEKATPAEVICWSGSTDSGTSADVQGAGIAVGAMSYAFLNALGKSFLSMSNTQLLTSPGGRSQPTYEELLRDLRRATRKYHQKPQLSSSHNVVSVIYMSQSRRRIRFRTVIDSSLFDPD